MKDRDTPLRLVRLWEKAVPCVYDTLDVLKATNGSAGIRWPDFCDLPRPGPWADPPTGRRRFDHLPRAPGRFSRPPGPRGP